MNAHLHHPRLAPIPPPATSTTTHRRNPLSNAINNHVPPEIPPKPASYEKKPSPPLPRQNAKVQPPSPPQVIQDKTGSLRYQRMSFLGEGGFARVYQVRDSRNNHLACKVVTKSSLKTKKAKTKLYAEIKIHKALDHPNIVRFIDCFEDDENVYMTLELCPSGSLMNMLHRRRVFTEPEARFFMVQLIGACHYMHTHQVIHRDLKLGNLFLDADMNIKVGDFGLAALIESPGERKKTICGTPNYIAPEVLFDTANGHSFEVDIWSIGVILYTFVVGRPPFQTKDVKEVYQRIRDNQYEFPSHRDVSLDARELVQQILTPNPQERPSLHDIVDHAFFTHGIVPGYIPVSARDMPPDFRHLSPLVSQANLSRLRQACQLDGEIEPAAARDTEPPAPSASSASSLAQQEREFQKAVQPGSPISALLSSARQPLMVAPGGVGVVRGEPTLLRKLQAAKKEAVKSPAKTQKATRLQGITEEGGAGYEMQGEEARTKELQSQKARIVAQMVPAQVPRSTTESPFEDAENVPAPVLETAQGERRVRVRTKEAQAVLGGAVATTPTPAAPKVNGFDAAAETLCAAFDAFSQGLLFRDPSDDVDMPEERVFIASWVDYCNKYGMGYALTDGSVGVHFNDSTTLVLAADKQHFDYISSRRQGTVYVRKNYTVADYPEELKSKVYLLKHFEGYIMGKLYGDYEYTFSDLQRTKCMHFVQKYLRMKHVIVFKLSHDVLQFNFYDHSKIILSAQGLAIAHIDKNYVLTRWTLSQVMAQALVPPSSDAEQAKFAQRLLDKLRYCKEVLLSIRNASASAGSGGSSENGGGVSAKPSKASLR
ncbi:kinase-like domain-containing protein [Lactarius akahatsu]|uniref:Serine/threonine-protein kinase n=1 Tax=Lactarius akahatsu TaxID=416441 RepID=A0AAD4LA40_9AGAM|nr:kinase-like domain-containing protein [Lactarius akahatsu]